MRKLVFIVWLVAIPGCGNDRTPTTPTPTAQPTPNPPPDVSGRYSGTLTLQVLRMSDNFQTSFNCGATMTVTQTPQTATLGGFFVSSAPCEPVSFDLAGMVQAGGATTIRTNGPRPPMGPCPGGKDVDFTGIFTTTGTRSVSARGTTKVTCPEFGDHTFTYVWALNRLN
jgi:hypothetical protein